MLLKILVIIIGFSLIAYLTSARPFTGDRKSSDIELVQVGVLPDQDYSWAKVNTDTTLVFRAADSLRPAPAYRFWLKLNVRNRSSYSQIVQLTVLPSLDNTLYYFDEDVQSWLARRAGVAVATDRQRTKGLLPLRLRDHATTCYVLVRLDPRAILPPAICLRVSLEPTAEAQQTDLFYHTAWAVSLAVLGLLLLTNLPTYARFRDRTTLYYLCTQVGAMLYVTAFRGYFKVFFPGPAFSQMVRPTGLSYA